MVKRKTDSGMVYESVVDRNLAHGDCTLTPDLVSRTVHDQPWQEEPRFRYGSERKTVDGDDESIHDIQDRPLPIRAVIVRKLFKNESTEKPWKSKLTTEHEQGWLVVTDTGWRFFPA